MGPWLQGVRPGQHWPRELRPRAGVVLVVAQVSGVKANVVFFDVRPKEGQNHTPGVWFYDLRTSKHFTLKTRTLKLSDLQDFITCFNQEKSP